MIDVRIWSFVTFSVNWVPACNPESKPLTPFCAAMGTQGLEKSP